MRPGLAVGLALLALTVRSVQAGPLCQVEGGVAVISRPGPGETVAGVVRISGSATCPDFNRYEVDYAPVVNPNDQWFAVQPPVAQQVRDGPLAVWDTTAVPDGAYQLRLRVFDNGGGFVEMGVSDVIVRNAEPTELPTVPPSLTPTPTPGTPTPGPSPTPLIRQPPTRTPRPTVTPGGPTPTPTPNPNAAPIGGGQIRGALCQGALATLGLFVLGGVYAALRAMLRGQFRQWWYTVRVEIINPIMGAVGRRGRRR
jgi:hypothetical protein